jgi:hypothetical protein
MAYITIGKIIYVMHNNDIIGVIDSVQVSDMFLMVTIEFMIPSLSAMHFSFNKFYVNY